MPRRIDYLFALPAKRVPSQKEFQLGTSGFLQSIKRFGFITGNTLVPNSIVSDDFNEYKSMKEFAPQPGDDAKFISDHHGLYAEFGTL